MRVDPLYSLGLTNSLSDLKATQNSIDSQLATGLRVQAPSDDPLAASEGVKLGSAIARDDAYVQSAAGIQSKLQVADSALGSVVSQITSAISLAVKGMDGTLNSADQLAVGQQISGIRDEVLSLANTSYAGSYLFSGTSAAKPYANDTSVTPAAASYAGDANQQITITPAGQKLATGMPGSAIFSSSGANVMQSLNALVADFSSGTVSASTQANLNQLREGLTNVNAQRSVLDASLNTLNQTSTYASTEAARLTASQSTLVAADTAKAATQLSQNETQQQALIQMMASAGKYNLFSYLQG